MNFGGLFSTVVALFLLMLTGYILGHRSVIDEIATKKLSTIIVRIGQPCLLVSSLVGLEYSAEALETGFLIMSLSVCLHIFFALIAFIFAKKVQDLDHRKIMEFSLVFTNVGFIGIPILNALYGPIGSFYCAFYMIGFYVMIWTWGVAIFARRRSDIRLTWKKVFINLGTVPSFIGVFMFVSRLPVPAPISQVLSYLSGLCTPVSLLIIGANLSRGDLKQLLTSPSIYKQSLMKLIVLPIVTTLMLWFLGLPDLYVILGCVMAAMPTAATVTLFSELYRVKPALSARYVGSSSVFCVLTLIPVVSFANWLVQI